MTDKRRTDRRMDGRRRDEQAQEESRRILERVDRESDLFLRMASRARDHFAARDAQSEDWTELWGRRIGRVLGVLFALALVIWLWSYLSGLS
ncbi:hypothetical protein [Chelativorans salis]|uniref:Uncharacterized protein n=1 Tax=Chelativorans salis TaxID=2978478 RepID=A0ABT2LPP9_9HYPH|nr:hypothetical protein [Chelativorans sp. EGI FJ00035]MCT7376523.1 hypothetical protein [Chelativorans sp. EGI FJ00035]